MRWTIQNNFVDRMTGRLARAVRESGRKLHDFSLVPGEGLPSFPFSPVEPHFFYGSTGLVKELMASPLWAPGLFLDRDSLDQRVWVEQRKNDMLNVSAEIVRFADLVADPPLVSAFVRPVLEQKAFSGQVVRFGSLSSLYRGPTGAVRQFSPDMLVAVSPVVDILAEYRFVVHQHRVVAGSRYRLKGQLATSADIPYEVRQVANHFAAGWLPSDFIVMDVATLPSGVQRIVEFNSVHSSGLYDIPLEVFMRAVETAVSRRASKPTESQLVEC